MKLQALHVQIYALVTCNKCNYNNVLREREAYLEVHATTNRVSLMMCPRANPYYTSDGAMDVGRAYESFKCTGTGYELL